jgi:hypothetical protein
LNPALPIVDTLHPDTRIAYPSGALTRRYVESYMSQIDAICDGSNRQNHKPSGP